jgi:hypothetical protein
MCTRDEKRIKNEQKQQERPMRVWKFDHPARKQQTNSAAVEILVGWKKIWIMCEPTERTPEARKK